MRQVVFGALIAAVAAIAGANAATTMIIHKGGDMGPRKTVIITKHHGLAGVFEGRKHKTVIVNHNN